MRYCRILRERQAATQSAILQTMGVAPEDIYVQVQTLLRHCMGQQKGALWLMWYAALAL